MRRPPRSTLFPYPTLFRSHDHRRRRRSQRLRGRDGKREGLRRREAIQSVAGEVTVPDIGVKIGPLPTGGASRQACRVGCRADFSKAETTLGPAGVAARATLRRKSGLNSFTPAKSLAFSVTTTQSLA